MNNQFIYIMSTEIGLYKIGHATEPIQRCMGINASSPIEVKLLLTMQVDPKSSKSIEKSLHEKYDGKRERGEWFRLTRNDPTEMIDMAEEMELKRHKNRGLVTHRFNDIRISLHKNFRFH